MPVNQYQYWGGIPFRYPEDGGGHAQPQSGEHDFHYWSCNVETKDIQEHEVVVVGTEKDFVNLLFYWNHAHGKRVIFGPA